MAANNTNNINVFLQIVDKLTAPLKNAAAQVSASTQKMNTAFNSVSNSFGKVNQAMIAITTVLAGGAAFKAAIDHSINYRLEVDKLSKTLGITLLQATGFKEALDDLGVSTEVLNLSSKMLGMRVNQSGKSLQDYTNSLTGNTDAIKNNGDAIMSVITKAQTLGDTNERNKLLFQSFGRSYQDALPLLRLTRDELAKVTEAVRGNEEVTKQQINQIYAFKKAQESGNDTLDAFKRSLGDQLLPLIADFANNLGEAKETAKVLGRVIGDLVKILYIASFILAAYIDGWKVVIAGLKSAGNTIVFVTRLIEAMSLSLSGRFIEATIIAKKATDEYTTSIKQNFTDGYEAAKNYYTGIAQAIKRTGSILKNESPTFEKPKDDNKPLPVSDNESKKNLEQVTLAIEQEISRQKTLFAGRTTWLNAELEKEYIARLNSLSKQRLTEEDRKKLEVKLRKELADIRRDAVQEQMQLDQLSAKSTLESIKQTNALSLAKYKSDLDNQLITIQQFLQKKDELLNADAEAEKIYYAKLKELALGNSAALMQIAQDEQNFRAELALKKQTLDDENNAKEKARLEELQSILVSSIQESFNGMLSGAMSFRDAIANIWQGIGNIIDKIIWQIVEDWIKAEALKVVSAMKTSILTTTAAIKAAAISTSVKSTETKTSITNDAAKGTAAAIAAWASQNPIAAIAIGAIIGAAIYSLLGSVKSAKGGWDFVPQDGAMAQLHKGEMVLPAPLAEGIRNIVSSGQTGSTQGSVTYNINAMDASSFDSYLKQNASSVFAANKLAIRNGSQFA